MLVVPLRVRGEAFGSLSIVRYNPARPPFEQYDIEAALDLANHAAMAISNSRLMRDVQSELALRVAAEDALRQSELLRSAEKEALRANRFLDAIVENIPDMIFVKDAEKLSFTRLNRAGEELLGIGRADLMGKTDYDFFPKEEAEFFQAKDRQTLASGRLVDIAEEPIETRRGKRWLHTKKVPIVDADGTPLFLLGISAGHHRQAGGGRDAPRGQGGRRGREPGARGLQLLGGARPAGAAPRDRRVQPGAARGLRRQARRRRARFSPASARAAHAWRCSSTTCSSSRGSRAASSSASRSTSARSRARLATGMREPTRTARSSSWSPTA